MGTITLFTQKEFVEVIARLVREGVVFEARSEGTLDATIYVIELTGGY